MEDPKNLPPLFRLFQAAKPAFRRFVAHFREGTHGHRSCIRSELLRMAAASNSMKRRNLSAEQPYQHFVGDSPSSAAPVTHSGRRRPCGRTKPTGEMPAI